MEQGIGGTRGETGRKSLWFFTREGGWMARERGRRWTEGVKRLE
jgi:hypothetical protein